MYFGVGFFCQLMSQLPAPTVYVCGVLLQLVVYGKQCLCVAYWWISKLLYNSRKKYSP